MSKLLSSAEIIGILISNDFHFVSQKGSHQKFKKGDKTVIVPSPKKEIPIGTFHSIIRQSGLSVDAFRKKI